MAKALKVVASVAAIAGLAIITGGAAVGLSFGALLSTSVAGISAGALLTASTLLTAGASLLAPKPKAPTTSPSNADRLTVSIDVRTPRKLIFGTTAMATDLRDQEWSADQSYLHRFVVVAAHRVSAIREIWFDDKLAWTSTGGVQADFAGYLTVTPVLEGSAANAINIGPRMGSSRRFTGCAYVHFAYKLTGNGKKGESPFSSSIPTRVTIIGDGVPTYDPRLDSTVPGGSGPMRADDQSTWAWNANASRNPAIATLNYLLGWRIRNPVSGRWLLSVGKGMPPARIDLASFITAANLCDEPVAKAAGGTEPRYRCDGIFSEGDDPTLVLDNLKASMNATLDDIDGRLRVMVLHNDLAVPAGALVTGDVLGAFTWQQTLPLSQSVNVVRGGYTDPSTNALFQLVDYPEIRVSSPDGIERAQTVNLPLVQSPSQAQRLAKQRLQRMIYGGTFTAVFQSTAWKFQKGDVIRLSFGPLGWEQKLFRIADMAIQVDGKVPMMLREEAPQIYAWDASDAPAVLAAAPTRYDPLLWPVLAGIADVETRVAQIASDNVLSAGSEKQRAVIDWTATYDELLTLNARWAALGYPPDVQATATAAFNAITEPGGLGTYLSSLGPPNWDDQSGDTAIVAAMWQTKWNAALKALGEFRAAITGRKGDPGQSALVGYLTNEAHNVAADAAGNPVTYAGASGQFRVLRGTTDVTSGCTFTLLSDSIITAVINSEGYYGLTGFPIGSSQGYAVFRATYAGYPPIDLTFTVTKTNAGANGAPAVDIQLTASADVVKYSKSDAIVSGPITFTTLRTNTSAEPVFRLERLDGDGYAESTAAALAAYDPAVYSSTGPDNLTVTQAWADAAVAGGGGGFRVHAIVPGGPRDRKTLLKVKDGTDGQSVLAAVLTNENFSVPTDASGNYTAFPVDLSRGQMRVYYGLTEVTSQCTFTRQNPANLDTGIDATGNYQCDGLYADSGYSWLIATYQGQSIALKLTASKVRGGASGQTPPLVALDATSLVAKVGQDGNYVGGQSITYTAVKNGTATERTIWRLFGGDGTQLGYGSAQDFVAAWPSYWTRNSDDSLTLNLAGMAYFVDSYGGSPGRVTLRAEANGVYDTVSLQRLRDGADGAPGAPGVSPVLVTAQPDALQFQGDAKGAVTGGLPYFVRLSAALAGGAVGITSITIVDEDECDADVGADGVSVRITAVSALSGSVTFDVVAGGQTVRRKVAFGVQRAPAALDERIAYTGLELASTSYVELLSQPVQIAVPPSGKISASLGGPYYAGGTGVQGAAQLVSKLQYRAGGGSWTDIAGTEGTGSMASRRNGTVGEPGENNPGSAYTGAGTVTGLTAATAEVRALGYRRDDISLARPIDGMGVAVVVKQVAA